MAKAMLLSVGGTPSPLIYALNEEKPAYIIFFVSRESRKKVPEILKELKFEYQALEQICTPSESDLSVAYKALMRELQDKLSSLDIAPEELIVDYTGGTKTMSAALVLVTIDMGCIYSYVGGAERDKGGIGVVINGKEKRWYLYNPWDELAVEERKRINYLFNTARYSSARETIESLLRKVSPKERPYYEMILDMVTGYQMWDIFNHKEARRLLNKSLNQLRLYTSRSSDDLANLVCHVEENVRFLNSLERGKALVIDLISNAQRRAKLEGKYDDATARLYRALEKLAQVELQEKYNINASNVKLDEIPKSLRNTYKRKYLDSKGSKIKLPLYASFELLYAKGNELGKKFFQKGNKIRAILEKRNNSVLAHGDTPVSKETYNKLLEIILEFIGINKEELLKFPTLGI